MIHTPKNKVFITATSSISPAGQNDDELFNNICNGITGVKTHTEFSWDSSPSIGKITSACTFYENIIIQCKNILSNSNLSNFKNTLLVVGSSVGGMGITEDSYFKNGDYKDISTETHTIGSIATFLQKEFEFYDDISFSTACTSSANALGYAYEVLQKGIYENALVIGVDSLCKTTVGGFLSLGVLSANPCKPFDKNRAGMNVSEAIACLLLETQSDTAKVEVCGVGYSSDAYHMTQPHPSGSKTAMQNALKCANIEFDKIDYINAHGTGTIANDESEAKSICEVFPNKPYVSSTKSITGHTLGAAGALEAIISCKILENQIVPTNTFLEEIDNIEINLTKKTIKTDLNYVQSNSFAFGGNNCSLIFKRAVKN